MAAPSLPKPMSTRPTTFGRTTARKPIPGLTTKFFAVTLPLSLPGVLAAFFFVFIPTIGEFVTPSLVGGTGGYMYGNQIVDKFGAGFPDWETGSVLALFLIVVVAVLTALFSRFLQPQRAAAG